jgi:hypothetical protein
MTLAMAAFTPFRLWPTAAPFGANGIFFVADTRYSFSDGRKPFDSGMKLFSFTRDAGCVCATTNFELLKGAVEVAGDLFETDPIRHASYLPRRIRKRLGAYDYDQWRRGRQGTYMLAIGYIDERGSPHLMLHGYPKCSIANQPSWGFLIGQTQLIPAVEGAIWRQINSPDHPPRTFDPEHWGARYCYAFYEAVIAHERHPSVGGGMQAAILTPDKGFLLRRVAMAELPGPEPRPLNWKEPTRPVTPHWRRGIPTEWD